MGPALWYNKLGCHLVPRGILATLSQAQLCIVPRKQQKMAQEFGSLTPTGRHGYSSRLLASTWSTLDCWDYFRSEPAGRSSLPLYLLFIVSKPFLKMNF